MAEDIYTASASNEIAPESSSQSQNPLSQPIVHYLEQRAQQEEPGISIFNIYGLSGYSNKLVRIVFDNGESIMVKQSQFEWAEPRFRSARRASKLIRDRSDIVAPEHAVIPEDLTDMPTLAYRYLAAPTLKDLWPDLTQRQRRQASRSLGHLLRKMHSISVDNFGILHGRKNYRSAGAYVHSDLRERIEPTIGAKWPDILPVVYRLMEIIESMPEKERDPVLVHNDLHLGNILCELKGDNVRCTGLLDLEETGGGRWELDLARAITLHQPLFAGGTLQGRCLPDFGRLIAEGYEKQPDSELLHLFRVYHLLDLGLYSAMNGNHEHAGEVGKEATNLLKNTAGF